VPKLSRLPASPILVDLLLSTNWLFEFRSYGAVNLDLEVARPRVRLRRAASFLAASGATLGNRCRKRENLEVQRSV
jgi:hypothetical protein